MIMRICTITLESATAYSASKKVDEDIHPKKAKEKPDEYDKRTWREKATYDSKTDIVAIPGMAFKFSVDEAIKRLSIQVPGRRSTTYAKFFVAGQIPEGDVSIGVKKDELEFIDIWANADGVRGSGKRVKRRFPYIPSWKAKAKFLILDDMIPQDVFEKAFTESGRLVGVGRFRPEKGGLLGRFNVTSFAWSDL